MDYNYKFGCISMPKINKSVLDNDFECVCDCDGEIYYQSKKTYEHREDGLNFDYKYIIGIEDMREMTGDDDEVIIVSLYLVPTFEYWNKRDMESIMSFVGADDIEDVRLTDSVMGFGNNVLLQYDSVKPDENTTMDSDSVMDMVYTCANSVSNIDSMRGFYLDKYVNRIGTTGWDIIKGVIDNKYNPINETLNRYKV